MTRCPSASELAGWLHGCSRRVDTGRPRGGRNRPPSCVLSAHGPDCRHSGKARRDKVQVRMRAPSSSSRPRVSVVTIFLDAARFLEEAIESVLAQTFDDWELILVDDGSSDDSTQIARGYADRWPRRIRYLEHPNHANLGMSASRNAASPRAAANCWPSSMPTTCSGRRSWSGRSRSWTGYPRRRCIRAVRALVLVDRSYEDRARDCLRRRSVQPDARPPTDAHLPFPHTREPDARHVRRSARRTIAASMPAAASRTSSVACSRTRPSCSRSALRIRCSWRAGAGTGIGCIRRHSQQDPASGEEWTRGVSPTHQAFLEWLEAYLARQEVDDREVQGALAAAMFRYRHPIRHALRPSTFAARAKRGAIAARARLASRVAAPGPKRLRGSADDRPGGNPLNDGATPSHPHRIAIPPVSDRSRPLWSVMVPAYDCAHFLGETLASVLANHPGPDIMQIEVVDDASHDDPAKVVQDVGRGRVALWRQPRILRPRTQLQHLPVAVGRTSRPSPAWRRSVRPGFYAAMAAPLRGNPGCRRGLLPV